ncbi:class F sortase [Streptomyces sp. NPDC020799]|uniref:class F sortase n=1 Tax=Streptomyces sp. NPDC020799 TaxID=3365091 RepID=UPI00379577B3
MSEPRTGGFTKRLLTGVAWAAVVLALCLVGGGDTDEPAIVKARKTGGAAAKSHPPARGLPPVHEPLPGAGPKGLVIKPLGIKAPVEAHGLDAQGGVEAPPYERANTVAWYQDGPQPGTPGVAVLVGHVDTKQAPAVFYELSNTKPGTKIEVARSDGSTAEFTVEDVSVVPNDHWDDEKVYGPRYKDDPDRPELRLLTCGGDYDRNKHTYLANIVVYAYLTGGTEPKPPPPPPPPPAPPVPPPDS